jgi:Uma2 family endonuclease
MTAQTKLRMKVPEFLAWAEAQPQGFFELAEGEVIMMPADRARDNLIKGAVFRALGDAVAEAGLACTVYTDGMTVVINEDTARLPDASVQCGVEQDLDSLVLESPLIVVEVVSPSSVRADTGVKLLDYFSVPSIRHYLIVEPSAAAVIHHASDESGGITTRILHEGHVDLSPPGMKVPVARLLGKV